MSNALGAVLQGLERGTGMGLNMYQALNNEARAKRQEQFQRNRAAREDFVVDRAYNTQMERYKVEDDHWDKSYKATIRSLDQADEKIADARAHNAGMRNIYQGQLTLSRDKFNEDREATRRTRALEQIQGMNQSFGYGDDGRVLGREEFMERLNGSGRAGTYMALQGYVNNLYDYDRLLKYDDAQGVPAGGTNMAVGVTSATGEWDGVKPATVEGSSREGDPVMVGDPYDMFLQSLPPELHREVRAQGQSDALIASDAEKQREALDDIEKERGKAAADIALAEEQKAAVEAELEEHLANKPPEPEPLSGFQSSANRARRLDHLEKKRNLEAWEKKGEELRNSLDPFAKRISDRQEQLAENEEKHSRSLAGIDRWEEEQRVEGNYPARRAAELAKAREKQDAADEANRKTVNTAVTEINKALKARDGNDANYLDPNMVQAQYDRLPLEFRQRLASAPGLLSRAVSHMGEHGLTSFEYLLDLTDVNDEGMQHYYRAADDPAVRSQIGDDPNQVHAVARAVASHMTATPGVSYGQTVEAVLSGKPLPEKNNSLGAAASEWADKWVAPGIRDMFR